MQYDLALANPGEPAFISNAWVQGNTLFQIQLGTAQPLQELHFSTMNLLHTMHFLLSKTLYKIRACNSARSVYGKMSGLSKQLSPFHDIVQHIVGCSSDQSFDAYLRGADTFSPAQSYKLGLGN